MFPDMGNSFEAVRGHEENEGGRNVCGKGRGRGGEASAQRHKHGVGTGVLLVVAAWPEEARARPALVTDMVRSWELDDGELRQWSSLSVGTERFRRGQRSR